MKTNFYYFADGILENPNSTPEGVNEFKSGGFILLFECKPEELNKCMEAALLLHGFRSLDIYEVSKEFLNDHELIKDGIFGRFYLGEIIEWEDLTLIKQVAGNEVEIECDLINN